MLVVAGGRHVAAAPARVPEVVVRSRDLDGEARIRNEFGEFAISRILKMKMKHHLEELLSTVEAGKRSELRKSQRRKPKRTPKTP